MEYNCWIITWKFYNLRDTLTPPSASASNSPASSGYSTSRIYYIWRPPDFLSDPDPSLHLISRVLLTQMLSWPSHLHLYRLPTFLHPPANLFKLWIGSLDSPLPCGHPSELHHASSKLSPASPHLPPHHTVPGSAGSNTDSPALSGSAF